MKFLALLLSVATIGAVGVLATAIGPASAATHEVTTARNALSGSGTGSYRWGELTVRGTDWNGRPAAIIKTTQWKDVVLGVNGGRWNDQIDFSSANGAGTESFEITFPAPASDVVLTVGMMGANEGGPGNDEEGVWRGYGAGGRMVASGTLRPEDSDLGSRVKAPGSYGLYPITLRSSEPIVRLELTAVDWDKNGSTPSDGNNTDFGVVAVSWTTGAPSGTPATTAAPTTTPATTSPDMTTPDMTTPDTTATVPAPKADPDPEITTTTATTTSTTAEPEPQPEGPKPETPANPVAADRSATGAALLTTDGLAVTALAADGTPANPLLWRGSVGVDAGRYDFQVDYDPSSNQSETLRLDLDQPATSAELQLVMLAAPEWEGLAETGRWQAFASDNTLVGEGWLDPADRPDRRFPLSFTSPASRIELTATAYGRGAGTDRMDNNSDFALRSFSWSSAEPEPSSPEPSDPEPDEPKTDEPKTIERSVAGSSILQTDGLKAEAFSADGAPAEFDRARGSIGVNGGRYDFQLDYDPISETSERIRFEFASPATNPTIGLTMMETAEWQGLNETARWAAYDKSGAEIGAGSLDPTMATKTSGVLTFPLDLTGAATTIELSATPYGDGIGTDRTDNNSDFAVAAISWSEIG